MTIFAILLWDYFPTPIDVGHVSGDSILLQLYHLQGAKLPLLCGFCTTIAEGAVLRQYPGRVVFLFEVRG